MSVTSIDAGLFEVRDHILIILTDLFELSFPLPEYRNNGSYLTR